MTTWYRDGVVTLTAGSVDVLGLGTDWTDNVLPGGIFFTPNGLYEVESVTSDTALKLVTAYAGASVVGAAYSIAPTQGYIVNLAKQLGLLMSEYGLIRDSWEEGGLLDSSQLAAANGSSKVGFRRSGAGKTRSVEEKLLDKVDVRDYGAICDGASRPLSTLYASLALAQETFPSATSLADELDAVAIQKCFDVVPDGTRVEMRGIARSNKELYLSKNRVLFDASGAILRVSGAVKYSLVVHGGALDRSLPNPAWALQLLTLAYETTTPLSGTRVNGLTVDSATGARVGTQVMFLFADDCEANIHVKNSNGNGVEFRQCVNPKFALLEASDIAHYGLFVYQCHRLIAATYKCANVGRAYDIKQRHKRHATLSHKIDRVIATDVFGFDDPVWCSGGGAYNELARAGFSSDVVAARNFAGHEISREVTIGRHDLIVSSPVLASVSTPSAHIGAFADGWIFGEMNYEGNGKDSTTIPLIIGSRGDIAEGLAGGATFGQNHTIGNVKFSGFKFTNANPLISYGVSCSIQAGTYKDCTVGQIINQAATTVLPFGRVASVEFRNQVGEVSLLMGPLGERGVRIMPETDLFISGGNRLKVRPTNSGANTICCPWYVRSDVWKTIGRDEIEVLDGGAAGSNHTTTYAAYTIATKGNINLKVTATAPATVRGIGIANAVSSKALVLEPSEFVLTGAPTGEKSAIVTSGEINSMGGHVFTGGWTSTVSDTSGKNSQRLRRTVFLTAAPTTGTWVTGDTVINLAPSLANPVSMWRCTLGGTPGTWLVAAFITYRGTTSARPVLPASAVGVQFLDTSLAPNGKLIVWTGALWADMTGTAVS